MFLVGNAWSWVANIRASDVILSSPLTSHWNFHSVSWGWPSAMKRNLPWSGLSLQELSLASLREWVVSSSLGFCTGLASRTFCRSGSSALSILDLSPLTSFSTASRALTRPLPPFARGRYSLSTQAFRWWALCIVISFLVLRSKLSRSSFVQFTIPAEYLSTATAYLLIVSILLLAYRWDLSIRRERATYYFVISFFISLCLMLPASKTPRYLYVPSSSSALMVSPDGRSIPEDSTLRPRLIYKVAHFSIPKSTLMWIIIIIIIIIRFNVEFYLYFQITPN